MGKKKEKGYIGKALPKAVSHVVDKKHNVAMREDIGSGFISGDYGKKCPSGTTRYTDGGKCYPLKEAKERGLKKHNPLMGRSK